MFFFFFLHANVDTWSMLLMHVLNKEVKQGCILMLCTLYNKQDLFPVYKDQTYIQGHFDFSENNILD